jgi:ParB family chromosome partitioning protein
MPDDAAPIRIHASKIELLSTAALKVYAKNARTHSDAQVDKLAKVIADSGFTTPLLIDKKNTVIAGHGRLLAAERLNMGQVPCVRVDGLSAAQIKALRLSDNRLALDAGWDLDLLQDEFASLGEDFDISLTGFDDGELEAMLKAAEPRTVTFQTYGEDIDVDHQCPKCGFVGSGDWSVKKADG